MFLFLHGFLGQKEDWNPLFSYLDPTWEKVAIDLPGHGSSPFTEDIALSVKRQVPKARFLIGYSAGGRVALELKERFPTDYEHLILISAHPGLHSEEEKKIRWEQDQKWIEKLQTENLRTFLEDWYDQTLFSSLKQNACFDAMLKRRRQQKPHQLAAFLQTYSIAKKPNRGIPVDAFWIYGKEDLKYEKLYHRLICPNKIHEIKNAGHVVHLENPKTLAATLQEIVNEHNQRNTSKDHL